MSGAVKGGRVSGASVLPLAIAAAALLGSASGHHAFGASHLRLRGGGREMELASAIQRSVDGIITADEAAELSRMGFLKGSFQADSEIEPESDIQDAHEAQWPDEWGGEEETGPIMKLTSGPVRLYSSNKYNHEILPTGHVKPETMTRLSKSLEDDAFESVPIVDHDAQTSDAPSPSNAAVDPRSKGSTAAQRKGAGGAAESDALGDDDRDDGVAALAALQENQNGGAEVYKGIPLWEGADKKVIDQWLKEAHEAEPHTERAKLTDVPSLDLADVPRSRARILAEQRLDAAIQVFDAQAVEDIIDEIRRIDEADGN